MVVVPFVRIDAVIKRLSTIRAAEPALVARVKGVSDSELVDELFSSGKVEEVD